jgi:acetyl-CoA carboxylase carboxyltransferase component
LAAVRRFLSYLPQNVWQLPERLASTDPAERQEPELRTIVPERRSKPYDMRRLVELVMDRESRFEIQPTYGKAVLCYLARLNGVAVGVVANNPMFHGGAPDVAAARKQRHFVDLCDCFHLPLIFLVDTPGFMIGSKAESEGALREGMRCLQACIEATVPMFTVIVRKCYGGAGMMTQHKEGIDLKLAWPSAEWGSLPLEGGVAVAFRDEIEAAPDPAARERELEEELAILASPFRTAEAFGVEDIIDPAETRAYLASFIETAREAMRPTLGPKGKAGVRP